MRLLPLAVVLLPLLAGCVSPAARVEPSPDAATAALDVALEPTDCELGLLIFPTSFEQAQRHLPPGFVARDAQAVLGAPAPTGRAAILLGSLACASSALGSGYAVGELLILVEAPEVDADLEPTTLDYYAPALHIADGPLRAQVDAAGVARLDGEMTLDVVAGPVTATARAALAGAEGPLWDFAITGAAPITATAFERIWHATPDGLAILENDYSNAARLGTASCTLGGFAASIVGVASCSGEEVVGAVVPTQSWQARLATLPGVHAKA